MANNAGAKKAIRKIAARTEVNKARRTRVRTFLRKFQEAVTGGDAAVTRMAAGESILSIEETDDPYQEVDALPAGTQTHPDQIV